MRTAWIISIGTELTLGQTVDTNAAWLAQRLSARGIRAVRHLTVADELADILGVLDAAASHADLVLITGGLGPTEDDLTRQALADAAGTPLEPHAESLDRIREYFHARGRSMHEGNFAQALLPIGAEALPNTCGTAPGIYLRLRETAVFALPGVPSEMKAMFDMEVAPRLPTAAGVVLQRQLRCIGEGEAAIGAKIRDLMARGRNPEIGTTARLGIVGVRINATADDSATATRLADEAETELRARLGPLVFGRDDETLAGAIGRMLIEESGMLAVAESCTAGLLGKLLTDEPGASRWFAGGVICYSDALKSGLLGVPGERIARHGAVSAEVAAALAENARTRLSTTHALSITGVAGPTGGSADKPVGTIFVGLSTAAATSVERLQLGADGTRDAIRERSATSAMNLLRLELMRTRATTG